MWPPLVFVCTIPWLAHSQIDRYKDNSLDWDIKLNVPGDAGSDYPTFSAVPRTDFTCAGREPGYYADHQTNCQVFRICTADSTYGFQSFLCPNGTLFNQAVFVCDWWMNVNCEKSHEIKNYYNERFVNLKPGPQLMQDVKKMITHPMRNPINNGFSKNGFLIAQTYKPPPELYPNGATSSHNNNIYVPSSGSFGNIDEHFSNDISFAASTASPQYSPYKQNQNTHNSQFIFNQRVPNGQVNKNDYRSNRVITTQTNAHVPRINENQLSTFNNNNSNYDTNQKVKHYESFKINQANPLQKLAFDAKNNNPINVEAQQNLVSTIVPPTIISKTIAFKSLVPGDTPGSPKSRITFKTWILKPKSGKLVVKPAFANNKLIKSASEQTFATRYIYEKPKQSLESSTTTNGYFYNNQETAKQTTETNILYTSPTTFRPNRLYLSPIGSATPTPQNDISTLKSLANLYLPPTDTEILSRQYFSPIRSQRIQSNINEKLLTASSSQPPQYELFNTKNNNSPFYTVTKPVKVNNNHNDQSYVLTKEKMDVTVSDIIKNTNKIIQSQSMRDKTAQYRNNDQLLDTNELTLDDKTINKQELPSKSPVFPTKSSTLISFPSINLQPPLETSTYISDNKLSRLPYYSEPVNTIERTVSIKITIPEKIARILFKNDSSPDDFEVLNTGSSNYLVYANNLASKSGSVPTAVGKLSLSKYSNISNSQDLVISFLADSLNAAKNYNNIAKQSTITTPTPQLQNYRYNNADDITSKISQLTSTQFTSNNNIYRDNNKLPFAAPSQAFRPQNFNYQQRTQTTPSPFRAGNLIPLNKSNRIQNLRQNSNQIYSGQLYQRPVPEVTRDYYNLPDIKNNQHTYPRINSATCCRTPVHNIQQNGPGIEILRSQQLPFGRIHQKSKQETINEQTETPNIRSLLTSTNGITAQVKDSIEGSLSHPTDNDKLLTYKKEQSYYIFSQLNGDHENNRINEVSNGKSRYDDLDLQLVPTVAYNLNDEKENQRLVSTVQSNFAVQRGTNDQNTNQRGISTNVDYIVNHPSYGDKIEKGNAASSYIPNQSQTNLNIEDLDSNEPNGYPKISPQPNFDT